LFYFFLIIEPNILFFQKLLINSSNSFYYWQNLWILSPKKVHKIVGEVHEKSSQTALTKWKLSYFDSWQQYCNLQKKWKLAIRKHSTIMINFPPGYPKIRCFRKLLRIRINNVDMKNCCQNNKAFKFCQSCMWWFFMYFTDSFMDLFCTKDSWVLPIIERIRRIDQQFSKKKYIWLNYQKKTRTKLISKHVFPALKNYHFWPFWKIHEWIVKKLDVLEKIWDQIRDQRVKIYQKYLGWFKREKNMLFCCVV
jgi:hypothetical protein